MVNKEKESKKENYSHYIFYIIFYDVCTIWNAERILITRPTLSKFQGLKINRVTFANCLKFVDLHTAFVALKLSNGRSGK